MKEKTQKQRLLIFADSRSMTQKDIERATGISNGTLCHAKADLTKYVQKKIFAAFPELNREWLLTGEGEMLIGTGQTFNVNMGENQQVGDGNTLIAGSADARVRALERENAQLRQQIAKLEGMIEVYKGMMQK